MKKIDFTKMLGIAALCLGLNQTLNAQCSTSFTYTTTTSGISATNTSTGTTGSTTYYWTLANSGGSIFNSSFGTTPVFNPLYNGNYVLTLLLDSVSGTCPASSQTITISGGTNAPVCSSNFTYTVGAAGYVTCTNTSAVDPLGQTSYSWSYDNQYIYGNADTTTFYYNGTHTVTLAVYNALDGCNTSSTQTISITNANTPPTCTSNFTYTVDAAGVVIFTSSYTGTMTPTDSSSSSNISWAFGDGQYAMYDSLTISHTYLYNGTYSATLNINDPLANCYSSTTQTISITNTATMPCTPSVVFYLHQDTLNPQPGIWEVSTYYSSQVTNAVWYWGDGTSTAGLSPTHTYSATGQYNICVTAYTACGDSAYACQNDSLYRTTGMISVTVLNVNGVTGIKTNTQANAQISVYPNPSTGAFTLNLTNTKATQAQINVTNILGEVVYSSQEQITDSSFSKEINLQNMATGTYFIKAIVGDKAYISKLIKN